MYQALYIGMTASILCMTPFIIISFIIAQKRNIYLKRIGIEDVNSLTEEDKLEIEHELGKGKQTIFTLLSLSLLLVYPAVIGNAFFRFDVLEPWFIFVCCFIAYSCVAFLFV